MGCRRQLQCHSMEPFLAEPSRANKAHPWPLLCHLGPPCLLLGGNRGRTCRQLLLSCQHRPQHSRQPCTRAAVLQEPYVRHTLGCLQHVWLNLAAEIRCCYVEQRLERLLRLLLDLVWLCRVCIKASGAMPGTAASLGCCLLLLALGRRYIAFWGGFDGFSSLANTGSSPVGFCRLLSSTPAPCLHLLLVCCPHKPALKEKKEESWTCITTECFAASWMCAAKVDLCTGVVPAKKDVQQVAKVGTNRKTRPS